MTNYITKYRGLLLQTVSAIVDTRFPIVIQTPEGGGKTSVLFNILPDEHFAKMANLSPFRGLQFLVFSFRSYDQAEQKLAEYQRMTGRRAVLIRSVEHHYKAACQAEGVTPLDIVEELDPADPDLLKLIRLRQPSVWERMEEARKAIWTDAPFCGATTAIFTVHAVAQPWWRSRTTPAWNHPAYHPDLPPDEIGALASDFHFSTIVHDEVEMDAIFEIIPQCLYDCINQCHRDFRDWRNLNLGIRRDSFMVAQEAHQRALADIDFRRFDELMRVNLGDLKRERVYFPSFPYGHDHGEGGIYRKKHGEVFYIGPKPWLSHTTRDLIFLTTEELPTVALERMRLETSDGTRTFTSYRLNSPFHPIEVPLIIADRANSREIKALVQDIRNEHPEVNIIADSVRDPSLALTYQKAKGANHLSDTDIVVIETHLSPDMYAVLATIGSYLDYRDVLVQYHRDRINQAVGRNTGFRDNGCKTHVIMGRRLWSLLSKKGFNVGNRIILNRFDDDDQMM